MVYRAMENGANARAEMAAEHMGVPTSEMSAMKITDMKDNAIAGEMSVKTATNEVSRIMQSNPGIGGHQAASVGAHYAAQTRNGPFAGAGEQARQGIVANHNRTAARVERAGRMGSAE
jgi:hypothetical protein